MDVQGGSSNIILTMNNSREEGEISDGGEEETAHIAPLFEMEEDTLKSSKEKRKKYLVSKKHIQVKTVDVGDFSVASNHSNNNNSCYRSTPTLSVSLQQKRHRTQQQNEILLNNKSRKRTRYESKQTSNTLPLSVNGDDSKSNKQQQQQNIGSEESVSDENDDEHVAKLMIQAMSSVNELQQHISQDTAVAVAVQQEQLKMEQEEETKEKLDRLEKRIKSEQKQQQQEEEEKKKDHYHHRNKHHSSSSSRPHNSSRSRSRSRSIYTSRSRERGDQYYHSSDTYKNERSTSRNRQISSSHQRIHHNDEDRNHHSHSYRSNNKSNHHHHQDSRRHNSNDKKKDNNKNEHEEDDEEYIKQIEEKMKKFVSKYENNEKNNEILNSHEEEKDNDELIRQRRRERLLRFSHLKPLSEKQIQYDQQQLELKIKEKKKYIQQNKEEISKPSSSLLFDIFNIDTELTTTNDITIDNNITIQQQQQNTIQEEQKQKQIQIAVEQQSNLKLIDNWDDSDGYYCFRAGDILNNRYEVFALQGQGVFSSVLRVWDRYEDIIINNNEQQKQHKECIIKIIRNNENMHQSGLRELNFLQILSKNDINNKKHCINLLSHFNHLNHLCLVFEPMYMNLREVLKKFGGIGLHIDAVESYSKQLIISLHHLFKCEILHADIKPDNILCNNKFNIIKLCDFGSAIPLSEVTITPLLYPRFYRPPEVILGMNYNESADMWAIGCVIFELYTGRILFPGKDNNDMLRLMLEIRGRFPTKMIRKSIFRTQHFDEQNIFQHIVEDSATGQEIKKKLNISTPTCSIGSMLQLASSSQLTEERTKKLSQLKDLLDRMLTLDPSRRITVDQALTHPFINLKSTNGSFDVK